MGPVAAALGGADLSYFVSFAVAMAAYLSLDRLAGRAGRPRSLSASMERRARGSGPTVDEGAPGPGFAHFDP